MDVKNLLQKICSAVEQHDGQSLAQLFCENRVYHDMFTAVSDSPTALCRWPFRL